MLRDTLLVIDDDEDIRLSLRMLLENSYEQVDTIGDPREIIPYLNENQPAAVLLDMNFKEGDTSGKEGMYWLEMIAKQSPGASIVVITAYGDVQQAVQALKKGAVDFLSKPWQNEKLLATVSAAVKLHREKAKVSDLTVKKNTLSSANRQGDQIIWGASEAMTEIRKLVEKVASTDAHVLITGENGTGKEMIAREIHRKSHRSTQVFYSIDLGAVKETLFESELFGHVKGAFTDAREERMGKMVAADQGTLFLDEIGNLGLPEQAKLLTVLQTREVVPVGSNEPIDIDIRLICATNSDLHEQVAAHNFREDLLYRINTIELRVPSLRERKEDIQELAEHFIRKYTLRYGKQVQAGELVFKKLQEYPWPGNIRELQHAVERAVILAEGSELHPDDFRLHGRGQSDTEFEEYNLEEIEEWAIRKALRKHGGNVSHAAGELGLSRGALYRRMEKYGL